LESILVHEDPTTLFSDLIQIGKGYASSWCIVYFFVLLLSLLVFCFFSFVLFFQFYIRFF
jgi:hypothetical protein